MIDKMFNLTTCSPELFAVVLSIVVPIPGAIVVVVVGSSVVEAEDILNLN
jgi:type III secretory pathway component EscU